MGELMYRLSDGVRSTHTPDCGIVINILRGELFNLNSSGSRILELFKNNVAEQEIAKQIEIEFRIEQAIAERDVHEFLLSLREHKVINEDIASREIDHAVGI